MLITNGTITTPGVRRRTIERQINFGPISIRFVSVILLAAAALITLAQTTQSATKNYEVQKRMNDVTKKEKEVEALRYEGYRLQSLQAITNQASPSPSASPPPLLEQADKINYLPNAKTTITQLPDTSAIQ